MTMITAHSGSDFTKDNSLEFVNYALSKEAECLEVDVRGAHGKLVISHDEKIIEIVELSQVFELIKEKEGVKVNCDLKEPDLEVMVYELAKRYGIEKRTIFSGTVDPEKFIRGKRIVPDVEIYMNIENMSDEIRDIYLSGGGEKEVVMQAMRSLIDNVSRYDFKCLNMNYHFCTEEVIDYLEEKNIGCSAWTVNKKIDIKRLVKRKITNITTRNLAKVIEWRKGWKKI